MKTKSFVPPLHRVFIMISMIFATTILAASPKPIGVDNTTEPVFEHGPLEGKGVEYILTHDYEKISAETGIELNRIQRWSLKRVQKRYAKLQKNPKKAEKFKQRIAQQQSRDNKFGLIALILGIAGIVLIWIPFVGILGFFALAAALTLGIIGIKRDENPGMAIAGTVLGGLAILLILIAFIVVAATF